MNQHSTGYFDKQLYYRLIAVWIIFEGLIGGIIFGLKLPVSGLIVGSAAITCISLIAYYFPEKGSIIKATILVAVFKMLLSPHTPPMAYIAVFFQGMTGELLFWNKKWFKLSCWLFASIAMAESAMQRILVLLVLYGKNFWIAINDSIGKIFPSAAGGNYTLWLAGIYILFHIVVGWAIVYFIFRLIREATEWEKELPTYIFPVSIKQENIIQDLSVKKVKGSKYLNGTIGLFAITLWMTGTFFTNHRILEEHFIITVIIRAILIMLVWYFWVMPVLKKLVKRFLEKERIRHHKDISAILVLLPLTKELIFKSWQHTSGQPKIFRMSTCCKIILANSLYPHES